MNFVENNRGIIEQLPPAEARVDDRYASMPEVISFPHDYAWLKECMLRFGYVIANRCPWLAEEERLEALSGRIVEVGGPTRNGYEVLNALDNDLYTNRRQNKNLLITNIVEYIEQSRKYSPGLSYTEHLRANHPDARMVVDATRMPFRSKSLDCIMGSYLNFRVRRCTILESSRVLKTGGLLVWQSAEFEDIITMFECGLVPVAALVSVPRPQREFINGRYNFIFKKSW